MNKKIQFITLAFFISFLTGCLKDTSDTERQGTPHIQTGKAVFWLGPPNTVDHVYSNPVTIYWSNGNVCIPTQTYNVKCSPAFPGCGSEYGKVFTLQTGSYYAKIVYSNDPNYQSPIFTVTKDGCADIH